jgi:glycosyltransferase involved in cell wall biosynthesis
MRIAQVAPLYESVPPRLYGGTERVVSYLTEELVAQGHDVTLFASADSVTQARLVPCSPQALRQYEGCIDRLSHHIIMLERVAAMARDFDIVHYHIDYLHYPLSRRLGNSNVTTLHGRLDLPDLQPLYREFADMPVVSISDAQRAPIADVNWQATVHHGLPRSLFGFHPGPGKYLAFLGRISPEKRVDQAIAIALRARIPLRIAAKVDQADQAYFDSSIRPLLTGPLVEFLGEIGDHEKDAFLGNARALLFPIDWPEPFGLVMIEAMACGTPVVAYRRGSATEVLDEGVTGFIVSAVDEAVEAVERVGTLDRRRCRQVFEERFSAETMTRKYLAVYRRLQGGFRSAAA